jgi:spore germination cell wall hydrolase CwlJ-like protein
MKLAWLLWLASVLPQSVADRTCLAATVYLEARSEPVVGQMAVAEVALRRRGTGRWGNTLCEVVRARGQFALSTTNKNYFMDNAASWQMSWVIAEISLASWTLPAKMRMAIVPQADHFFATGSTPPAWAKGEPLATIGDHRFYRAD